MTHKLHCGGRVSKIASDHEDPGSIPRPRKISQGLRVFRLFQNLKLKYITLSLKRFALHLHHLDIRLGLVNLKKMVKTLPLRSGVWFRIGVGL